MYKEGRARSTPGWFIYAYRTTPLALRGTLLMRRGKSLFLHHNEPVDCTTTPSRFTHQRIDFGLGYRLAGDDAGRDRGDGFRQRAHIAARQSAVAAPRREPLPRRESSLPLSSLTGASFSA